MFFPRQIIPVQSIIQAAAGQCTSLSHNTNPNQQRYWTSTNRNTNTAVCQAGEREELLGYISRLDAD